MKGETSISIRIGKDLKQKCDEVRNDRYSFFSRRAFNELLITLSLNLIESTKHIKVDGQDAIGINNILFPMLDSSSGNILSGRRSLSFYFDFDNEEEEEEVLDDY